MGICTVLYEVSHGPGLSIELNKTERERKKNDQEVKFTQEDENQQTVMQVCSVCSHQCEDNNTNTVTVYSFMWWR